MDSSIAYQGIGRDLGEKVRELNLWATRGLQPDLTVVLDIDPALGLSRVKNPDRLESEPIGYHRKVRQGFLDIAQRDPDRYLVIDASTDIDQIAQAIRERIAPIIGLTA
jgi:dTMP kinase